MEGGGYKDSFYEVSYYKYEVLFNFLIEFYNSNRCMESWLD